MNGVAKCENCRFFVRDPQNLKQGACRAHPPELITTPQAGGQVSMICAFPTVQDEMWCGEYEAKAAL